MEKTLKKALKIKVFIGFLIIIAPVFITGKWFIYDIINNLLVAEFVVRSLAVVIGLFVIYDSVKTYYNKKEDL
ncbi:hypothetical protein [Niallia sp. NCCP-28]|uniref:hypothetical protein n=1 Tax=Niallia sp. NCCP-28 TaxID=2934712 RepID=UPI0020BE74AF|nr:hypothetical protein [Niallia sp. NCCP-28]